MASWRPTNELFGRAGRAEITDPGDDGCEVVNGVADRIRAEFLRRIGLGDLYCPY